VAELRRKNRIDIERRVIEDSVAHGDEDGKPAF